MDYVLSQLRSSSGIALLAIILLLAIVLVNMGCIEGGGSVYSCTYEKRSTGCGGKGWKEWKASCHEFDMEDANDDWTPEKECEDYQGSKTHCAASCCIEVQFRNLQIHNNGCQE